LDVFITFDLLAFDGELGVEAFEACDDVFDLLFGMIQLELTCLYHFLNINYISVNY
jgi:hypothetical protein